MFTVAAPCGFAAGWADHREYIRRAAQAFTADDWLRFGYEIGRSAALTEPEWDAMWRDWTGKS